MQSSHTEASCIRCDKKLEDMHSCYTNILCRACKASVAIRTHFRLPVSEDTKTLLNIHKYNNIDYISFPAIQIVTFTVLGSALPPPPHAASSELSQQISMERFCAVHF